MAKNFFAVVSVSKRGDKEFRRTSWSIARDYFYVKCQDLRFSRQDIFFHKPFIGIYFDNRNSQNG